MLSANTYYHVEEADMKTYSDAVDFCEGHIFLGKTQEDFADVLHAIRGKFRCLAVKFILEKVTMG